MKILVLENDLKELALIQSALPSDRYTLFNITSVEQAWAPVQSGEMRFLIANWDTSDIKQKQFVPRIRAAALPNPVYILITSEKPMDDDLTSLQVDDVLGRPFKAQDLKNRVKMAERILSLAGNLAVVRDQLEAHALFEPLTGFMNQNAFLRQSTGEMERARRASQPVSLITLDIDNFKTINDTFGPAMGDDVLRVVSQSIREKSRPYDCIGHWAGGDEFVILVTGVIGADAEKIADRIIAGVRGTRVEVQNEAPLSVKISAGIASASHINTSIDIDLMVDKSQQAVARAKEAGGNQVFLIYI